MNVNVRTFSSNPSKYLQQARLGLEVIITHRDGTAVRLVPIEMKVSAEEQRRRLAQIPGVKLGKGKPDMPVRVKLTGEGPSAAEMVLEDRR